jgi:ABC-type uncharacterized transport system substrate-binding protein
VAGRRAAHYIDRILKGENPADMPVQTPTNYAAQSEAPKVIMPLPCTR